MDNRRQKSHKCQCYFLVNCKFDGISFLPELLGTMKQPRHDFLYWEFPSYKGQQAVRMGDWIGDVKQGGSVNFKNVKFNPHGNGTHTECVGHISPNGETINQCLKQFFFLAELVSIYPQRTENGDRVIYKHQIAEALNSKQPQATELMCRIVTSRKSRLRYRRMVLKFIDYDFRESG